MEKLQDSLKKLKKPKNALNPKEYLEVLNRVTECEYKIDDVLKTCLAVYEKLETLCPIKNDEFIRDLPEALEKNRKDFERFDIGLKELRGLLDTARSIVRERKDTTPRWYDIEQTPPPKSGQIWVRDIDGQETMATCLNCAIVYPIGSSMKLPKFWKPL